MSDMIEHESLVAVTCFERACQGPDWQRSLWKSWNLNASMDTRSEALVERIDTYRSAETEKQFLGGRDVGSNEMQLAEGSNRQALLEANKHKNKG
jgi:hypothetical protein